MIARSSRRPSLETVCRTVAFAFFLVVSMGGAAVAQGQLVIDEFDDGAFITNDFEFDIPCSAVGGLRSAIVQDSGAGTVSSFMDLVDGEGHADLAVGDSPLSYEFAYGLNSPLNLDLTGFERIRIHLSQAPAGGTLRLGVSSGVSSGGVSLPVTGAGVYEYLFSDFFFFDLADVDRIDVTLSGGVPPNSDYRFESILALGPGCDTELPVVNCPSNMAVTCASAGGTIVDFDVTATDDCDPPPVVVCDPPPGSLFPPGFNTVTCTATNDFGETTCSFTINVVDHTPPVITCPPKTLVPCTGEGGAAVFWDDPTATDDCDPNPVITCDPPEGTVLPLGIHTVTCTATDFFLNQSTCTFTVVVFDGVSPEINCPGQVRKECTGPTGAQVFFDVTATDDCDPDVDIVCDPPTGTTFPLGLTMVMCTATDDAGNISTCSFPVFIEDTTAPMLTCPDNLSVACDDNNGAIVEYMTPTATDLCDPMPSVVCDPAPGTLFPMGATLVTCTATDSSGNSSECTFWVFVADVEAPVITCANAQFPCVDSNGAIVDLNALFMGDPMSFSVSDNCDDNPQLSFLPPSNSLFPLGANTVRATATDATGNASTCVFTLIISDTTAPVIDCPLPIKVECDPHPGTRVDFVVTATDNCDPNIEVICDPPPGSLFDLGFNTVVCTATDVAGNSSTCTFQIIVVDTQPPVIMCPDDVFADCNGAGMPVVYDPPYVSDCDPNPTVVCDPPSGSLFPDGTTVVTCTATDNTGNSSTCTFNVTVGVDTESPVVNCPMDTQVECMSPAGATVGFMVSATDNCDTDLTVECMPPSGSVFPIGDTLVTCTATDDAGNVGSCNFTITVVDTTDPVLTCPQDVITVECDSFNGTVVDFPVTATDACDPNPRVVCDPATGSTFPLGFTQVTCTATDASGNFSTCTFTVHVEDTTRPALMCNDVTVECSESGGATVFYTIPIATDACDPSPTVTCMPPPGSFFPLGATTVTCTATDMSNNSSGCMFLVIVEDNTAPVIICPDNILVPCGDPPDMQAGPWSEIGPDSGGFDGQLVPGSEFGSALTCLGDVDGDGIVDLAVGLESDDDGGVDCGAVWILFMNADGSVRDDQKISSLSGRFAGSLSAGDAFGSALAMLDDLDGDGVGELVVGARGDSSAGTASGAVWVLFLDADGTVKAETRITSGSGGFKGALFEGDGFGASVSVLDDLDGDGLAELVVGAAGDDDGGLDRGALWLLMLDEGGSVRAEQKISSTSGGFAGTLEAGSRFGSSIAPLGDLRGDGTTALAVGAPGATGGGAAWILFLDQLGVSEQLAIAPGLGGFDGKLDPGDAFGAALSVLASGDAEVTLAVAASGDDDAHDDQGAGAGDRGAVWILHLDGQGQVTSHDKISDGEGGFTARLSDGDRFGRSLATLGDLNGDGSTELAAGGLATGKLNTGSVFVISINDRAGGNGANVDFEPMATDICDPDLTIMCFPESGSFFEAGTTTEVECWATDDSNNVAHCTFMVTVEDDQPPTIECPDNMTVECDEEGGAKVSFMPMVMDDCTPHDEIDVECTPPSGAFFPLGTTTVTCTAFDGAGNQSEPCFFDVTVVDTMKPFFTRCPNPIARECTSPAGRVVNYLVLAEDICDPDVDISCTMPSGSTFPLGSTTVICTAVDDSMNTATCSFTVLIVDTMPPTITCPGDQIFECGTTLLYDTPMASDLCDPDPTVSCFPPSGSVLGLGVHTVTCTATDSSMNFADCTFTVTIVDRTNPTLTCPFPMDVPTDGGPVQVFFDTPMGMDTCDSMVDVVCAPPSGSLFPVGTTMVTCTATDDAGNTGTCEFDINVFVEDDVTAPEVGCPGDMLMVYDGLASVYGGEAMPVMYAVSVVDADPNTNLVCNPPPGSLFAMGSTNVVCTATDTSGNVGSCSFVVTVVPDLDMVDGSEGTSVLPFVGGSGFDVPPNVTDQVGFESDAASASFGEPWRVTLGDGHTVRTETDRGFGPMPTRGSQYAELSAAGTNAATPPSRPGRATVPPDGAAGIAWDFRHPADRPILSFEAAFLSDEEPGSVQRNDFLSVDVMAGGKTVNLYHADTFSKPGGEVVTVTADLSVLFPESTTTTEFTLTAQVGNGGDDTRPSRAQVDGFRFHGGTHLNVGTGSNPIGFASACTPRIGGEWRAVVDTSTVAGANASWVVVHDSALPATLRAAGELLVDLTSPRWFASSLAVDGPASVHVIAIPDDLTLIGMQLHAQAAILGPEPTLTNAIELELRE